MNAKLTYSFFIAFAACLLSSCSSAFPDNVEVGKRAELSFDVSNLTRASVTTSFDKFAVYGDMKFPVNDNTVPTVIFNKTEVEYKNGSWSYDGTQYWFPKHEHSFVAVSPLSVLETDNNPRYSDSQFSFTYSIPTTDGGSEVNKQELADIIAAAHRRIYDETVSPAATVKLKFFHIMSRINFLVKCDGAADKITITEIEFEGINKTGTFTIIPASLLSDSGQTDDYNLYLTGFDKGTLTAGIDVDVANDNEAHSIFPDDNALFMVPQPENKGIIMKITYKYDTGTATEEQTLTAQEAIGGWESGKLYLYSLTVDTASKEISMTVSVKEWEHGADNDVCVPRK